jgi:phosphoglycerate kinase
MRYLSKSKKSFYAGKTVLVRLDLNIASYELRSSARFDRSLPTLEWLRDAGCRIVVISHRGRPDARQQRAKRAVADTSLRPFVTLLSRRLKTKVFFDDLRTMRATRSLIPTLPPGGVVVMENIRLWPEEEKNDPVFAKRLASLGDVYVNDAFAVSHRAHASVDAITRFLPSFAGLELEKELRVLDAVMKKPRRPLVLILGGAKISDKIGVLKNFWKRVDAVIVGGGVANTFLAAQGMPMGHSVFEPHANRLIAPYLKAKKIYLPDDVVIGKGAILDIGARAARQCARIIKKAGTIVWNGPMGYIEEKPYDKGTLAVARACGASAAFSVVGGGETTSFLIAHRLDKKMSFLSTGGGAMLDYLAGEKLPGIQALKRTPRVV